MSFGEKLQYLRKAKGLSQEQLAAQVTVSRQAVSRWELNATMPDTDNILQISRLFGVTTDYLLDDTLDFPIETAAGKVDPAGGKSEMPAEEISQIQPIQQKKSFLQIALLVLAIYMITFAIAIMAQPRFMPFFAMIATSVSILAVIIVSKKRSCL